MTNIADEQQQQDEGVVQKTGEKAKEGVETAASAAGEKAGELRQQGSEKLQQQLDQRSTEVGSQARSVAEALRGTTGNLREQGNSGAATFAEQAAEKIEQLGGYLERMDGQSLMRDLESFARRRPWALAGVGFVVGLIGARFAKASSPSGSDGSYGTYGGTATDRAALPSAGAVADPAAPGAGAYPPAPGLVTPPAGGAMASDAADMPLAREPDQPDRPGQ